MPSDASLPPNAPTTTPSTLLSSSENGSIITPQSANTIDPSSTKPAEATADVVDGEANALTKITSATLHELDHEQSEELARVPTNSTPLNEVCADVHARVTAFLNVEGGDDDALRRTQQRVRESVKIIAQALEEYGFEHLSLSYNGGKDCLVLLLLYLSVLHTHFTSPSSPTTTPFPTSIPSIYATPPDPFPAVTSFVATSTAAYHLSLTHIRTNPPSHNHTHDGAHAHHPPPSHHLPIRTFRDAFALYLSQNPRIRAIFVGTRRTDPHGGKLGPFNRTDGNWPDFMRVHPVLEWGLGEIWCFLRHPAMGERSKGEGRGQGMGETGVGRSGGTAGGGGAGFGVEYCQMYDEGYTSLGGRGDTVRNPRLRVAVDEDGGSGGEGKLRYRPAWMMVEDRAERDGRE